MLERPERTTEDFPLVQDPPFRLQGARTFLFALPCERGRLDTLLTRSFGWAAPEIRVRSLGSTCLLAFLDVARATAKDPAFGSFSYREVAVFVPVRGERNGKPFFALHVPFLYPNEGLAIAAGREVYGLPKKPGIVDIASSGAFWNGDDSLALRVLSAERFDGSPWATRPLVTATTTSPRGVVERLEHELHTALDALAAPLANALPGGLLRQDLLQLKQVADVTTGGTPARSLYRAVVSVKAPIDSIEDVVFGDADRVEIRIADLASEPLARVLGLGEVVVPKLAAQMTLGFRFEDGEIWREEPDERPRPSAGAKRKERVLILGGGMSALATAHALTDTAERRERFDVHVLAQGHLLGGKGASTRNPALGMRNQEHGIHVLFGFYHNTLRMLRGVYGEASRPTHVFPPTFADAFRPEWKIAFDNGKDAYSVTFPKRPEGHDRNLASVAEQVKRLQALAASVVGGPIARIVASALFPERGNRIAREVLAFAATLLRGVLEDVVLERRSWDELDEQDFRAWMRSHRIVGLPDLSNTAIMQVPYDGIFAYVGADQSRPRLGAGIAARELLKLVTHYEVAPYFAMTAGMGECVFAPLYDVLRRRGVRFEFFGKVKELAIEGGRAVAVRYARQAEVTKGPYAYEPLVTVGSIPAWRHEPDAAQLAAGSELVGQDPYSDAVDVQAGDDRVLSAGKHFDWIVCTLPAPVTARVLRGHAPSSDLAKITKIPTVATLHVQTWFHEHTEYLGFPRDAGVLGGFPQPLNSMHVRDDFLGIEAWPEESAPKGLLYLSGPFGGGWDVDASDPAARSQAEAAAEREARAFIAKELGRALEGARGESGGFDERVLYAPTTPDDPMADQYFRANVDLSARYVLCVPGGLRDRPGAVVADVANLRLAGDWTKNGIDIPCIEATVVSALRAAESILGEDLDVLF